MRAYARDVWSALRFRSTPRRDGSRAIPPARASRSPGGGGRSAEEGMKNRGGRERVGCLRVRESERALA